MLRQGRAFLIVSVIAASLAVGVAGTAGAAQFSWSGPIPVDRDTGGFALRGVDCPSSALCVGIDGAGQAVAFDPSNPANPDRGVIATPEALKAGGQCQPNDGSGSCASSLVAVSCPSESVCAAVDNRENAIVFDPADPAAGSSFAAGQLLTGIDCPSVAVCVISSGTGSVVEFDPATRAPVTTVLSGAGELRDIACPSPGQCTVTGLLNLGADSRLTTFNPVNVAPSAHGVTLTGESMVLVDCAGGSQCSAVSDDASARATTFDPASASAPAVATIGGSLTSGLDCPGANVCTVVNGSGFAGTFDPQNIAAIGGFLNLDFNTPAFGVDCTSSAQCIAVDRAGTATKYNPQNLGAGKTNSVVDGGAAILGVSCPSATICSTVGYDGDGSPGSSTGHLSTFNPQAPAGPAGHGLPFDVPTTDVDCPSATKCVAVDNLGTAVSYDPAGLAAGGGQVHPIGTLIAVDCPSTAQCTTTNRLGTEVTFGFPPTPQTQAVAGTGFTASISCPSTSQCTTVDQVPQETTFDPANPNTTRTQSVLTNTSPGRGLDLSCPSLTQCTAGTVNGYAVDFAPSGPQQGQTIRAPQTDHSISAVDCPTVDVCALGDTDGGASIWTHSGSPNRVKIPGAANITDISCPTEEMCVAVDGAGQAFVGILGPDSPGDTTPPTIPGPGGSLGTPAIGGVSASGAGVDIEVRCEGPAGATCPVAFRLTAKRASHRTGKPRMLAREAACMAKRRKRIVVGAGEATVAAGTVQVVHVVLNRKGRKLLSQLHKLKVRIEGTGFQRSLTIRSRAHRAKPRGGAFTPC